MTSILENELQLLVAEFVNASGEWHLDRFAHLVPELLTMEIRDCCLASCLLAMGHVIASFCH